ncbi:MAG: chemotaxis protein CheW [Bdellovibrionota bacterium]|nr:chemotaxis protein CheW [Bdellovibrionota bacterium]
MENDALKNEFLVESFENLSSINEDLTRLEKDPSDQELLNKIYRTVHTMKGSASFLGYKKLQEITHTAENLLDELREGNITVTSNIVDTLLETFDICHNFLKNIETTNIEGEVETKENQKRLEAHLNGEGTETQETESSEPQAGEEDLISQMSGLVAAAPEEPEQELVLEQDVVDTVESDSDEDDELDLDNLVQAHRSVTAKEKTETQNEASDMGLSSAALESLKELVSDGKIDASAFDDLEKEVTASPVAKTEFAAEPEAVVVPEEVTAVAEPDAISSAAMDSLRELISDGKIDSSALDEIKDVDVSAVEQSVRPTEIEVVFQEEPKELIKEEPKVVTANVVKEEPKEVTANVIKEEPVILESKPVKHNEPKEVTVAEPAIKPQPVVNNEKLEDLNQQIRGDDIKKSIVDSFVRVNVNVLDKIMNVVGELVLNRNQILQYASKADSSEFNRLSQQLNVITSELQSEVMSTRMQPIGNILTKFERLVRDIARSHNKKINLNLMGSETELDKSLLEAIKDPLVHIIRNSCDHGIEDLPGRKSAGKAEHGTVTIKAYNESGQVTIEIFDDGKGLDPQKIGQKAVEKGIISEAKLNEMSESQIINLIFKPGFSTAEKVTNISGRGVGMDVVKTNIEKIGGTVSVNSNLGHGTNFKLRIPLTLAIVPSLMIKSKGENFAIPQLNLVELVRLETSQDHEQIETFSGSEFLRLRGKLTPIFRLDKELNLEKVQQKSKEINQINSLDALNNIDKEESGNLHLVDEDHEAVNIVILNAEDNIFGIVVDEIMDTEEIVVKALNNKLKDIKIFGGATIMGDGSVALILDAIGFLSEVSHIDIEKAEDLTDDSNALNAFDASFEYQENLLFKLYDDRVYAIPLTLVSRLEEFDADKIEKTGSQKIVRYLDAPMPLIGVEKALNLEGKSILEEESLPEGSSLSCIVTKIRGRNFGIIVKEVMDISIDHTNIDDTAVDREGIIGTIFIDEKTVPLLDLYSILAAQNLGVSNKERTNAKMTPKTILLVDDSPMYRKLEADSLREIGYTVITANHGLDGFEKLRDQDFDLLITDIEMPHLDGFGFAKKVRDELPAKKIPIIALSTRVSEKDLEKGRESGFNHHLEKFRKEEVVDLVNSILQGSNYGNSSTAS